MTMRTLIADDHTLFSQSLQFLLEDLNPTMSCETANTLAGALARPGPFDLILLDYDFPREPNPDTGLERMRQAHGEATIVMVSGVEDPEVVRQLIARGAAGFVPKNCDISTLLHALRTILAGGIYVPPFALRHEETTAFARLDALARPTDLHSDFGFSTHSNAHEGSDTAQDWTPLRQLSERQIDCLLMAAQGKSNRLIAAELFLAESTVKTHVTAAFKALGVKTRAEAVFRAASLGLLPSSARQANGH